MATDDPSNEQDQVQVPTVSSAMRRRLETCFEHGQRLTSQKKADYDYANTMFTECVVKDPGNLRYVEAFFDNLCRKYKNNKKGARFKASGASKGAFKKAQAKKEWPEVLNLGPDILKTNPWDVSTLRAMAEACAAFHPHLNEVEPKYLRMALDAKPKDVETNRHCAKSLTRMGQYDQAIACWRRVEEVKRNDAEANRAIANLMVEKTRTQVGIDDHDDLTDEEKAKRRAERGRQAAAAAERAREEQERKAEDADKKEAEPKRRVIPLTPRQELEQAINENPLDMDNYVALAELLTEQDRTVEVGPVLQKAVVAAGDDIQAHEQLTRFETRQARHQFAVAQKRAQEERTEETIQLVKQMKAELNRQELDVYADRCDRFPDRLVLKYELALRLKRAGKYDEAIEQFNQCQEVPRLKALSVLETGECYQQTKRYNQALECYKEAVEMAKAPTEVEYRKLALYRTATLAFGLKDLETTERYYAILFEFDPDYKDVRARLDKIKEIRYQEGSDA